MRLGVGASLTKSYVDAGISAADLGEPAAECWFGDGAAVGGVPRTSRWVLVPTRQNPIMAARFWGAELGGPAGGVMAWGKAAVVGGVLR